MASRIRIYDHFAKPLVEVEAPSTPRSWILNGYGRCEFSISTSDPKCTETNMQFGNLVFIEHLPSKDETGQVHGRLPDWVGIIIPPRNWSLGVLHMSAYSAEAILKYRAMPFVELKATPGEAFKKILEHAQEKARNIIIQPGVVDDTSLTYEDDLRTSGYDHILKLIEAAGMDWSVTGEPDEKGNLQLFANLYSRKGDDTSLILHNNNTELESPLLTEQGVPSNQVFGHSQASTTQSRQRYEALNQGSIDDYGPFQLNQVYTGQRDRSSVVNSAQQRAEMRGRPVKKIHRVVLDHDRTFSYLDTGNTVEINETNVGFSNGGFGLKERAKIISMDYNDLSNKVPLNIEVI